ncbi:biotin--protein ligase isoform X3 [Rhinoraja longicauda]
MLITLCYLYLWLRFQKCYAMIIWRAVRRFHQHTSLAFVVMPPSPDTVPMEKVCVRLADRAFLLAEPQKLSDDLSKWSLYEPKIANPEYTQHGKHIVFLIEAALENVCFDSISVPSEKILKYSDLCTPLAYLLGDPYKLIAETNVDDFSRLGVAFMENRLQMDDRMVPRKIISLQINESVQMNLLKSNAVLEKESKKPGDPQIQGIVDETPAKDTSSKPTNEATVGSFGDCYSAVSSGKPQQRDVAEITEVHTKEFHASQERMELEDHQSHHLHLASCSECLEMENSTIESVRYASAENLLDLSDDYCGSSDETVIGEDNLMENTRQNNKSGKPPNVLIYVGSNYSQYLTKFQQVKSILMDCLDNDRYAIYPLLEEQILKEPWADNSLLLVVACDKPVSEQINGQFMSYLSKGGKILGLCTPFCFGEIKISHKNELKEKIHGFSFTKSDGTDVILDAFTSGKVFLREMNSTENSTKDLVLLGSLTDLEKDMVIVRLSYGEHGGEAVLCQETQRTFLRWLWPQLDEEGVLKSPKISLKVVTKQQPGLEATPSSLPLVMDSHNFSSEYFDMKIYCENLQTQLLGQLIFFSEVIPTTMDVFDGLMLQLPEEVGLIAIAVRQTQGKGRGQNIWISPIGSAMFTIQVRIQLNSQLGHNISFLQHLVALAAVESVLSIPGYEDIDLKVKWPNDIYFSNLMKLGGVLVNSTLMGTTFHMLIGCGFNVANSNPTICINDIIQQHNKVHGTHLQPLRTDQLMARTVTVLENLISTFQTEGANGVLPLYYKRWVHSGTQVRLWKEDGPAARIVGLDDSGFLQVLQEGDNNVVTVQPDGNSFDMLRNLIITKQH